jgi:hypothetical protein
MALSLRERSGENGFDIVGQAFQPGIGGKAVAINNWGAALVKGYERGVPGPANRANRCVGRTIEIRKHTDCQSDKLIHY